ncbi:MAG: DNA repair exonuclease [Bryobacteraceae bacterium]
MERHHNVLTVLHTADWHLGHTSRQLDADTARKLSRARLGAVDTILGLAQQYSVDAVLCAGDIFDSAQPEEDWWRGLASAFARKTDWNCPVILLPGNHDPLTRDSVYQRGHAFRQALPPWVNVVDRDDFEFELGPDAVVYAKPCRSTAGADDPALGLPARAPGDERIRIGLAHGSTFDLPDCQTNFPIARDATAQRGLDYLAIGDTHGFRIIPENAVAPIVYPGTPEPTNFKEHEAGYVAIVSFRRRGVAPKIRKEPVARWKWRDATVQSIVALRNLAAEDLSSSILRLHLDMAVSIAEHDEIEAIVKSLVGTLASHGRAAAVVEDRTKLKIEASLTESDFDGAPDTIREVATGLKERSTSCEKSRRALVILHRLFSEVR